MNAGYCDACAKKTPMGVLIYTYTVATLVSLFLLALSAAMFRFRHRPLIKYVGMGHGIRIRVLDTL